MGMVNALNSIYGGPAKPSIKFKGIKTHFLLLLLFASYLQMITANQNDALNSVSKIGREFKFLLVINIGKGHNTV